MTSIIIPAIYRPDLTEVCVDSILKYTKDFELILVQEGEDEKIRLLFNIYKQLNKNVKISQNKTPKGYAGAMNTGMSIADPETNFYCFMNNDTVATPGWLDEMLKVMENPEIGLVSPTFNGVASRQNPDWNSDKDVEMVYDPLKLMGVCFLIRRGAMDIVKNWDEDFGLGGEEDYDMCIRIQNIEFGLAIARKSFIYHYGGASFKELFEGDLDKCLNHAKENFHLLEKKHNIKCISE